MYITTKTCRLPVFIDICKTSKTCCLFKPDTVAVIVFVEIYNFLIVKIDFAKLRILCRWIKIGLDLIIVLWTENWSETMCAGGTCVSNKIYVTFVHFQKFRLACWVDWSVLWKLLYLRRETTAICNRFKPTIHFFY